MSEINYEEDNYEENDSVIKSVESKPRKRGNTPTAGKKARRSRIIINDTKEINDNRREYYDPEIKYKKCLMSASAFNDFTNTSRRKMSKHFLKRKVRAAFEREPLEKAKGFSFNVPFLPTASMFVPAQSNAPTQQAAGNRSLSSSNPIAKTDNRPSEQPQGKTVSINLSAINKMNEIRNSNLSANIQQGKSVFNVNQQSTQVQSGLHMQTSKPASGSIINTFNTSSRDEKRIETIIKDNKSPITNNNNIQSQSTSSITFASTHNHNTSSTNNSMSAEQMESIKAKILQKHFPMSTGSHTNWQEIMKNPQQYFNPLIEAYKKDPEKFQRERPDDYNVLMYLKNMKREREIINNKANSSQSITTPISNLNPNNTSLSMNKPTSQHNFHLGQNPQPKNP